MIVALGCFFAVSEADVPKVLPPPSACWVTRFSELRRGWMTQHFGWEGDPGQAAMGSSGWRGADVLFPDRGGYVWASGCPGGVSCAHGAGELLSLRPGSFLRQHPRTFLWCPGRRGLPGVSLWVRHSVEQTVLCMSLLRAPL